MHNYTTYKTTYNSKSNNIILYIILLLYYIFCNISILYILQLFFDYSTKLNLHIIYYYLLLYYFLKGVALSVDFARFFVCARFGWLPGGVVVASKRSFLCMALFLGALAGAPPLFFGKVVQGRVTPPLDTRRKGTGSKK